MTPATAGPGRWRITRGAHVNPWLNRFRMEVYDIIIYFVVGAEPGYDGSRRVSGLVRFAPDSKSTILGLERANPTCHALYV